MKTAIREAHERVVTLRVTQSMLQQQLNSVAGELTTAEADLDTIIDGKLPSTKRTVRKHRRSGGTTPAQRAAATRRRNRHVAAARAAAAPKAKAKAKAKARTKAAVKTAGKPGQHNGKGAIIVEYIKDAKKPVTIAEISKGTGIDATLAAAAMFNIVHTGKATREKLQNGGPVPVWHYSAA